MTRHDDRGFTLIEVVVVVVLIGIVALALGSIFSVFVRTTPPSQARADDSRSLLGISTWLPADVSSTPRVPVTSATSNWDDDPGRVSGCAGTDPGINIVRLEWREQLTGSPQTFISAYRLVDDGDTSRIVRLSCVPAGSPDTLNVTADLPPSSASPTTLTWKTIDVDGVPYINGLALEITTFDGETLRVDASSRNPNETLPTVPDAVTTTAVTTTTTTVAPTTTTTTSTTTTTTGPGPTTTTAPNQPPAANPLAVTFERTAEITFTVPASDPDGDTLTLTLDPLPTGWPAASTTGLDVTIPSSDKGTNDYTIGYTVTDPSGATATETITITLSPVPCVATFDTGATPSSVSTSGGSGHLASALPITIDATAGDCAGELLARFEPTATGTPDATSPTRDFGAGVLVTIGKNDYKWVSGSHVFQLVREATAFWPESVLDTHVVTVS